MRLWCGLWVNNVFNKQVKWHDVVLRRNVIVAPAVHVGLDRVFVGHQFGVVAVDLLIHQTIVQSVDTALHELDARRRQAVYAPA